MLVTTTVENQSGQYLLEGIGFDRQTGHFVADALPSGIWRIVVSAQGGTFQDYEARQEIDVNADIRDLPIAVHPASSIPIIVNHATSPIADSAEERYRRLLLDSPELSLSTLDPDNWPLEIVEAGDPPALMFAPVPPGKYRLHVGQSGLECLDSAWYKGVSATADYLRVTPDGGSHPLTLNMTYDCASLVANIRPRGDQKEGYLVVIPTSSAFADAKTFKIGIQSPSLILSPGAYQIFAFSDLNGRSIRTWTC
ncbi:MAG TPA: hypothetical protein VGL97_22600 [Bryobacteraceae bacterium]|jgi:hypothetical protein